MGRHGPALVVLASVGAGALVLGTALVDNPGFVIPLFIESVALILVTLWLIRRVGDAAERRFVGLLLGVAAALRLAAGAVVYTVLDPFFFAIDASGYAYRGNLIAQYWAGATTRPPLMDRWQLGYEYMNAVATRLLGDPVWAMVVLNVFASLWTVLVAYVLARACFGRAAARVTAVLVGVFPSLVLWSVLNIRDAVAMLVVTMIVYLAVRVQGRVRPLDLVFLLAMALGLSTIRDYMGVLIIGGLLLGLGATLRPGRIVSTFVVGIGLVTLSIFFMEQVGFLTPEQLESPLQAAEGLRRGLQGGGAAYGTEYSIETPGDAVRYLPIGLTFFLFAPFPWAISSLLQVITLPEVLLWYALVPFTVRGFRRSTDSGAHRSLLVLSVLLVTVTTYALVEGNFGTAYRHRAQVLPLFFVFAGKGLADWWRLRKRRAQAEQNRRVMAKAALVQAPRARR